MPYYPIKMSFHTVTMFVRWAITTDEKTSDYLDNLKQLPLEDRLKDERVISLVRNLRKKWSTGTKIERLATLGWIEHDSICIFSNMLTEIDKLRQEYAENVKVNGTPPSLQDVNLEQYEKAVWNEIQEMKKS
jgi:hypothetical protein